LQKKDFEQMSSDEIARARSAVARMLDEIKTALEDGRVGG
jgi:hypothetical protein